MQKEFSENSEGVHLMHGEFTLCGDAFDIADVGIDADTHDGNPIPTRRRTITCSRCIEIIMLCRNVRIDQRPR